MANTITVYTTATCGYCHMLKSWLDEHKFSYTEKRVDQDYAAAQEMMLKSKQMGVPYTVITNETGETGILGFDVARIQNALLG